MASLPDRRPRDPDEAFGPMKDQPPYRRIRWYSVPPYRNEGWQILNEHGELVATFEDGADCQDAVALHNGKL